MQALQKIEIKTLNSLDEKDCPACQCKSEATLTEQFASGILQDKVDRNGIDPNTLIHEAILENNSEVIRFLIAHGADVDYPDENGMSPLTIAILNRSNFAVEVLLTHWANPNPEVMWNGMPLLELALLLDDKTTAKLLVDAGADVNCALHGNWKDFSLLTLSMAKKDLEFARILINAGAKLNYENNTVKSPLVVAVQWNLPIEFKRMLIEKGADVNVKYIANPGAKNPLFQSLLYDIIQKKDVELARDFVNAGADLNQMDYLSCSIIKKLPADFINLLLIKGADVNGCPTSPGGPLSGALHVKDLGMIQFLVSQGADVNLHHPEGLPILLQAVQIGDLNLVKCLVDLGADVNITVNLRGEQRSPLKVALNLGKAEIVQYLFYHGARA